MLVLDKPGRSQTREIILTVAVSVMVVKAASAHRINLKERFFAA
jgi:hypothetical protein